jgi:GC-rich sequence DNA-binding factor
LQDLGFTDDGADLAGYTEAKDRLYIGKKANKEAARRVRGEMDEMIADRCVEPYEAEFGLMSP